MSPACRSSRAVEGRLHSVHEWKIWHGVQTEDGQVRPDLWLLPVRSTWPPPLYPHWSTTVRSPGVHFPPKPTLLRLHSVNGTVWQLDYTTRLFPEYNLSQVNKHPPVDWSKWIQICYISDSIVKPNLPQPLPPQYVPTAVCVYVYINQGWTDIH